MRDADRNLHERQMIEKTDPPSRFSLPIDFDALAARLDPKPAPAEVSTDQLKIPGTVALWRPAGAAAVASLPDASDNGNDLTPITLSGSTGAQTAVTVGDDHDPQAPSGHSLVFSGDK